MHPQNYTPPVPPHHAAPARRTANGLGIAGLAIGLVALAIAWISYLGLLAIPVAVIGAIFAGVGLIVALSGGRWGILTPVLGLLVSLGALALGTHQLLRTTQAVSDKIDEAGETIASWSATNQEVVVPPGQPAPPDAVRGEGAGRTASAEYAVRQGNVQVRVVSVRVVDRPATRPSAPTAGGPSTSPASGRRILVTLEQTNPAPPGGESVREVKFGPPPGDGKQTLFVKTATLTSDGVRLPHSQAVPSYHYPLPLLQPGESATEVLEFEAPNGRLGQLKLELPATRFDGTGYLRFHIPPEMVR